MPTVLFSFQVAVVLLQSCEGDLLAMNDMEYMVDFLRKVVPRWPRDKLQVIAACSVALVDEASATYHL